MELIYAIELACVDHGIFYLHGGDTAVSAYLLPLYVRSTGYLVLRATFSLPIYLMFCRYI